MLQKGEKGGARIDLELLLTNKGVFDIICLLLFVCCVKWYGRTSLMTIKYTTAKKQIFF